MNFNQVRNGMRARVIAVTADHDDARRLQEMGLTEGTEFTVVKVAPFGDPVEIRLRGYHLCLRKRETQHIDIEVVE